MAFYTNGLAINASEGLEVLSNKIGIRRTTAHCLRHSSVTFLASNGHDLQQVQKFARHSSINMTRSYFAASHLQLEQMTKTMEKLTLNSLPIKKAEMNFWDKPAGLGKSR